MFDHLSAFQKNILRGEGSTSEVGTAGESLAADYLRRRGFTIVAINFRVPVGRNRNGARIDGELDLIAMEGEVICFVEVKTRTGAAATDALAAVDARKQRQVAKAARAYQKIFGLERAPRRFDAIGINMTPRGAPEIKHIRGFWQES